MLTFLMATIALNQSTPDTLKKRGFEVIEQIRKEYYLPESKLYAEEMEADGKKSGPAFNWGVGVMLTALNSAAKLDAKYKPWLREYADATRIYWNDKGPVPGYDVLPCPKPVDRYYDDNAWMVLALVETYEILGDKKYLDWAEESLTYVLSGWDDKLGGGIYWRESDKKSKNTCSNGPSAAACLRVYRYRDLDSYLRTAVKILRWTDEKFEDPADGLFWDNMNLDGKLDNTKWSYNTGLMLRSRRLLDEWIPTTGNEGRLKVPKGLNHWFDASSGAFKDDGKFAHLYLEGFLAIAPTPDNKKKMVAALDYVHEKVRGADGRYGNRWDRPYREGQKKFALIDQASAARAFLFAAGG